jgi:epidermal growth factor receptor substrate 15
LVMNFSFGKCVMTLNVRLIVWLKIICLSMLLVTATSNATVSLVWAEKILEQDLETVQMGLMIGAGVLGFLMLVLFALQIKVSRTRKLLTRQSAELNDKQGLLDDFKVGMLHLNHAGEIIFANKVAGSFLGSTQDKLLFRPLFDLFDQEDQPAMVNALSSHKFVSIKTFVNASKRHILLGFNQQSASGSDIYSVISIADISHYQLQIDHGSAQLIYLNQALENNQLGQLKIDFANNSFTANAVLANMLSAPDGLQGNLEEFAARIDKTDLLDWQQALEQGKTQHSVTINCGLLLPQEKPAETQSSEPKEFVPQNVLPVKLTGLSRNQDQQGNTTCLEFIVTDCTKIETYKNQVQASQQQIKTLISVSPNPIYVLDNQAKFVNCNTEFEKLFKQKLSKIQQKSIEELAIFPSDLVSLHLQKNTNFVSVNVGQEKEFVLKLANGESRTLKLKLKFFADEHNNRAGVVGVIQDVTELRQATNELEEARKHFTSILDLAPAAVTIIDAEDKIVRANIAMTDRLGLSERDLKKGNFYQIFNDPSNAGKAAKQIHQTGRLRGFQAQLKGKHGELHASELHVDLLDKEKQEYLCWISDRTGEQFQQDKFEGLLQHSSMPMAILAESGFTHLNPAACDFFHIQEQEELFGVSPFSVQLNEDQDATDELERHITKVKLDGQAKSFEWQHKVNQTVLPCQATYVPMYKGKEFDSILCIWVDFREIKQADEARLQAQNLHQAAEQTIVEKQQLLNSSQDQLASRTQNLAETKTKLQMAQENLSEKQTEFSSLQEAHQYVTDHLVQLKQDYNTSRTQLSNAQTANTELTNQLQESMEKVDGLQAQRNQISDALQNSEKKYRSAQQELLESERNSDELKQQQNIQQGKMDDFVSEIDHLKQSIDNKDQQIFQVGDQINSLQTQLQSSDSTSEKLRELLINQRKASVAAEEQRRVLEETCTMAQSELSNKGRHLEHLQNEMEKFEEMSNQQKGDMQQQQSQLMEELAGKQQQLQDTQNVLDETKRAAEQEKLAKEQQHQHLEKLQTELAEMEENGLKQRQKIAKAEQNWQQQQQEIQDELAAKQQLLLETEQRLQQAKVQSEAEKAQKQQQLSLFEKLQSELIQVEERNVQQQQQIAQRDGQWQLQQQQMKKELKAKQQQLQDTEHSLTQTKEQTLEEKKQQQALFEKLQIELQDMEEQNIQQQQQMAQSDKNWHLQQSQIQQELQAKQQQLQDTEQLLSKTKQQTATEKAEKEQQQNLYEKLQGELAEMEHNSAQQRQKIAQSDNNWQSQQQALQNEVEAKRQQLQQTQDNLNESKRQADAEKLARLQQQQKLEQLTVELTDVESRAVKQKEMIEGSDEQWRKHHDEIEQQKLQLQDSLVQAEQQNGQLREKLQGNLKQLQNAESQVTETQSGEQKLQSELNDAREQANELQQRLVFQEQHEVKLQQQLEKQQQNLQGSEQSIHSLEEKQAQLTQALKAVHQQYSSSKQSLNDQHSNQEQLTQQLQSLEQELDNSKTQLDSKEQALQQAQEQLQNNQSKLVEQENALLSAHKEELLQAAEHNPEVASKQSSIIASLDMPVNPTIWFDLLPYLQKNQSDKPLAVALNDLIEELRSGIEITDNAVEEDDVTKILRGARKLVIVANKVNSVALIDVVSRLEADCQKGLVDNIAISWPAVQRSLNNTLRVVYSHLYT